MQRLSYAIDGSRLEALYGHVPTPIPSRGSHPIVGFLTKSSLAYQELFCVVALRASLSNNDDDDDDGIEKICDVHASHFLVDFFAVIAA